MGISDSNIKNIFEHRCIMKVGYLKYLVGWKNMEKITERALHSVVFFLDLHNNYSAYAQCAHFIGAVQRKKTFEKLGNIQLRYCLNKKNDPSEKTNIQSIYTQILKKTISKCDSDPETINSLIKQEHRFTYIFEINIDPEMGNDISFLHYYFLLRQLFKKNNPLDEIFLILKTSSGEFENSLKFKISHYLSLELRKDRDCALYIENGKAIHFPYTYRKDDLTNTSSPKVKMLKDFFPLLEINYESYKLLSKPIGDLIKEIAPNGPVNALLNTTGNSLFIARNDDGSFNLSVLLYNNTFALLNSGNLKTRLKDADFNFEFFKIIKNIPLLALMIFAVSFRETNKSDNSANLKDVEITDNEIIGNETQMDIYEAVDYADGILQLIENIVVHSQNKEGYFSFRIHQTRVQDHQDTSNLTNAYLQKEYKNYFNFIFQKGLLRNENQGLSFLELFLSDAIDLTCEKKYKIKSDDTRKDSPVTNVFINNVETRCKTEEYLRDYLSEIRNVQLYEFFGESEHLKSYEADPHNIINHYGLKRFSNSVSAAHGYFSVTSTYKFIGLSKNTFFSLPSNLSDSMTFSSVSTIPGTFYQILLPIRANEGYLQKFTGLDTNSKNGAWKENFDIYLNNNWKGIEIKLKQISGAKYEKISGNSELIKNSILNHLEDISNFSTFFVISIPEYLSGNNSLSAEIISKAIIQAFSYRNIKELQKPITIVLGECPKFFIPEFFHYMMIAYDRFNSEIRSVMENRQIYCYGEDPFEDFLIKGKNLKEMFYNMTNRYALRGTFPSFMFLINFILSMNDMNEINSGRTEDEIPFDLILKRKEVTFFEERAKRILEESISTQHMGCKIDNTHVFIGSKIHLHKFYDAEILFQSNYFATRFAALLARDIFQKIMNDKEKDHCHYKLIGYGNYSEVVINQTNNFLDHLSDNGNEFKLSKPVVVDPKISEEDFKQRFQPSREDKYIFIVPINSTLTTHNKLYSWVIGYSKTPQESAFANYALVVVRDNANSDKLSDQERVFWSSIRDGEIFTHMSPLPIKYFVTVSGFWEDPLRCSICYPPTKTFRDELPLIETNITSVIPMLQLENDQPQITSNVVEKTEENVQKGNEGIKELANTAIYSHTSREDNHYLFYFSPDQLVSNSKENIKKWLRDLQTDLKSPKIFTYSFLVTPLNDSETKYVELINKFIFNDSAQILRFEINREYRSNFVTKYSYITSLYENLHKMNSIWSQSVKIQFIFVDDGIITGHTVERAKSLLNSLFPFPRYADVNISILEGIFVLINRLSKDSIRNYVDEGKYYSYVNFPVSSIRNNSQFCYLCKLSIEEMKLADSSSLNIVQSIWQNSSNKLTPIQSSKIKLDYSDEVSRQRVISAARISKLINDLSLKGERLSKNSIIEFLYETICANVESSGDDSYIVLNEITSILEQLTRPFFVYKYSTRSAVLQVLLLFSNIFMEEITSEFRFSSSVKNNLLSQRSKLGKTQKEIILTKKIKNILKQSNENKVYFFNLLVEELSELGSTRIIRKDFVKFVCECEGLKLDWFLGNSGLDTVPLWNYVKAVTKTLKMSRDESKSTWLEYLITHGTEFQNEDEDKAIRNMFIKQLWESRIGQCLYLENTKTIQTALFNLAKVEDRKAKTITESSEYYLDNFRKILEFNNALFQNCKHEWEYSTLRLVNTNVLPDIKEYPTQLNFNLLDNGPSEEKSQTDLLIKSSDASNNQSVQKEYLSKISYQDIVEEMIKLERYLQEALKETNSEDSGIFTNHFTEICGKINKIALGAYSEFILVPFNEINSPQNETLVFARKFNEGNFDIEFSPNYYDEFSDTKFSGDTYYLKNDKLIIKISDHIDNQKIFLVIHFSHDNHFYQARINDIAFTLRNILLFRGQIQKLISMHLNENSIQSWALDSRLRTLLSNTKNIDHSSKDIKQRKKIIERIKYVEGESIEEYSIRQQTIALKLMADINISGIYHNSIIGPDNNQFIKIHKSRWETPTTLASIPTYFSKELCKELGRLNSDMPRFIEWELPEKGRLSNYYLTIPSESFLLYIPLLENAIKYSPENGTIRVGYSPFISVQNNDPLYYLCITNELVKSQSFESNKNRNDFLRHLETCLTFHVEDRWFGNYVSRDTGNTINGITLYAANFYCRKVLLGLGKISKGDWKPVIKTEITKSSKSGQYQLVVKVPLLHVEKEENDDLLHN